MKEIHFQTLIQITDIGIFTALSDTDSLIWLNSLETRGPIADADIKDTDGSFKTTTNEEGIAKFKMPDLDSHTDYAVFSIETSGDDAVILYKNHPQIPESKISGHLPPDAPRHSKLN